MEASDPWARLAEALLGAPAFTPVDVAQQAGVDPAETRRLWLALGFPLAALLFCWIVVRTMVLNLWQGGIYWRGTFYPLRELKQNRL